MTQVSPVLRYEPTFPHIRFQRRDITTFQLNSPVVIRTPYANQARRTAN